MNLNWYRKACYIFTKLNHISITQKHITALQYSYSHKRQDQNPEMPKWKMDMLNVQCSMFMLFKQSIDNWSDIKWYFSKQWSCVMRYIRFHFPFSIFSMILSTFHLTRDQTPNTHTYGLPLLSSLKGLDIIVVGITLNSQSTFNINGINVSTNIVATPVLSSVQI